jgi:hypothetical protein
MSEAGVPGVGAVLCPVCGAEAQAGCVYAVGPLFRGLGGRLVWRSGPPGTLASATALLGGGVNLGAKGGLLRGACVEAIRCTGCGHIVLRPSGGAGR